jgi:hypothetical protein
MGRKNLRGFQANNIGSKIKDFTENAFVLTVEDHFLTANIIIAKILVREIFGALRQTKFKTNKIIFKQHLKYGYYFALNSVQSPVITFLLIPF